MANGKPPEDLRREVDAIDDALHDLLMRRASVTDSIARLKPRMHGHIPLALAMRPAREAEIMRRFIARHAGGPPIATVIRVIREVLAASLAAQTPFRVHVFAGDAVFADLAHAHFGAGSALTRHEKPSAVLSACALDSNSLGVVPSPHTGESDHWWVRLAAAGSDGPRVIARLPFLIGGGEIAAPSAYVIAAIEQEPTGDDTTLLLGDAVLSPAQLKDAGILVCQVAAGLFEANGFVVRDDPRLEKFSACIVPVGGYANPMTVKTKELTR